MVCPQSIVKGRAIVLGFCLALLMSSCSATEKYPDLSSESAAATVSILLGAAATNNVETARTVVSKDLSDQDLLVNLAEIRSFIEGAGGLDQLSVQGQERMGAGVDVLVLVADSVARLEFSVVVEDLHLIVIVATDRVTDYGPTSAPY